MAKKILFPKGIIIETKDFRVEQDWETPIEGFFIVASKKKQRTIAEFSEKELQEFVFLVAKVRKAMEEVLAIKDVYLFHNEDTAHGFHLWMFPRHKWMEKFGRKIQSVRPIMDYAEKNMAQTSVIKKVNQAVEKMKKHLK